MKENPQFSRRLNLRRPHYVPLPRWLWLVVFFVCAIVALAVGKMYFHYETDRIRFQKHEEIAAVGKLKIAHIQEWRHRLLSDVKTVSSGPLFRKAVAKWLMNPTADSIQNELLDVLRIERDQNRYVDALVTDMEGNTLLSTVSHTDPLSADEKTSLHAAITTGGPALSDLFLTSHGKVLISAVAPVTDMNGKAVATVIIRCSPDHALYPLIQTWPTPSSSAETILVRRDGDQLLYLTRLRHRPDDPLTLRVNMDRTDLPSVQAALGKTGRFEGTDYRNAEVIADLRAIPETPWHMVAKVDSEEILGEMRYRGTVIIAFTIVFVTFTAILAAYIHRRRETMLYRDLYRSEREQREIEGRYKIIFESIGDAVITTNASGRVDRMNPVAETLTGWSQAESEGMPAEVVFNVIDEDLEKTPDKIVELVLREAQAKTLGDNIKLIARDGSEYTIDGSGYPIHDRQGHISGAVLVFRDQSAQRAAQTALIEAIAAFQQVLSVSVPLCIISTDFVISSANESFCQLFQINRDKLIGKICHKIWKGPNCHTPGCMLTQILSGASNCSYEAKMKLPDSSEVSVIVSAQPLKDASGEIRGILESFIDITDLRLAERALGESEEVLRQTDRRLETILETSPAGMIILDCNGRIEYANQTMGELFSLNHEELIGTRYIDLVHPSERSDANESMKSLIDGKIKTLNTERRYVAQDSREFVGYLSGGRLLGDDGGLSGLVGIITDTTSIRHAEALQRRLATAIDQASEGIVITDTNGIIQYVNPAMEMMTGYAHDELIGSNPSILKSGQHDSEFYRQIWLAILSGAKWSGRFVNRRKNGQIYHEEATISPVKDAAGKIVNFVGVKRDITEHIELSNQLVHAQKMEAVGTLAGGIAHDFNNILQVVLGYCTLILGSDDLPESCKNDLQKIHESAKRGADLVHRLLTFSRKTLINPQPINLNQRIKELVKIFERTIPKMIQIQLTLDNNLATINADPIQMDQVLMNLTVNARDAMPEGGRIVIETRNVYLDEAYTRMNVEAKPGPHVKLTVSDNGIGMDQDIQDHIFEPFFTTKELGTGTGLGLATVHGIVLKHAGHITCSSAKGHGTSFNIYIPAALPDLDHPEIIFSPGQSGGTETILLVDDDDLIRELGTRMLIMGGYHVITAKNGMDALDIYMEKQQDIALIVLDLLMPEMGGKRCLEELLKFDPDIKVLMASGYLDQNSDQVSLAKGAKGFIPKPFELSHLLEMVRNTLDGK